jgi:hypothetical protein
VGVWGKKKANEPHGEAKRNSCVRLFALLPPQVKDGLATITDEMIDAAPTADITQWLSQRAKKDIPLAQAVAQGMVETVREHIARIQRDKTGERVSFADHLKTLFEEPTAEHITIVKLLLDAKLARVDERVPIRVKAVINGHVSKDVMEDEISWPLYAAAERGQLAMVRALLPYMRNLHEDPAEHAAYRHQLSLQKHRKMKEYHDEKEESKEASEEKSLFDVSSSSAKPKTPTLLDRGNLKRTTALWIAASNKHVEVVLELLKAGASPNVANHTGVTALHPAIQKGNKMLVEILLDAGTDCDIFHPVSRGNTRRGNTR